MDRRKWKKKNHSRADFTLNKSDFNSENTEFRYIGVRKVSESTKPYGIEEAFEDWLEIFEKHNLDVEYVKGDRIFDANNIEIQSLSELIGEIIEDGNVGELSFRNNAFFLICLEYFIVAWEHKLTYEATFASIIELISTVNDNWGVDFTGELEEFAGYVYHDIAINCGFALTEIFRIIGVQLEFE